MEIEITIQEQKLPLYVKKQSGKGQRWIRWMKTI